MFYEESSNWTYKLLPLTLDYFVVVDGFWFYLMTLYKLKTHLLFRMVHKIHDL